MYLSVYLKKDIEEKMRRIAEKEGKKMTTLAREWVEEKVMSYD